MDLYSCIQLHLIPEEDGKMALQNFADEAMDALGNSNSQNRLLKQSRILSSNMIKLFLNDLPQRFL